MTAILIACKNSVVDKINPTIAAAFGKPNEVTAAFGGNFKGEVHKLVLNFFPIHRDSFELEKYLDADFTD